MFTVVSFYTKNTPYEEVMNNYLRPSLESLQISHKIYEVESKNHWARNTQLKPTILKRAFSELQTDLVMIDADAKVYQFPNLFNAIPDEYDCALFYLDWSSWYRNNSGIKELCSGTMMFRNRQICHELLNEWENTCTKTSDPDQKVLNKIIEGFPDLKIYNLSFEYCWITSLPGGHEPFIKRPENVVIEHFQKSRTLRRKI